MKKLLVPTDFSDGAFNALIYALQLAKLAEAKVLVVHAYLMPPTGTAVMVDITEILRKNAEEGLQTLRERVDKLALSREVQVEYKAVHGTVTDALQRTSKKEKTDLVVMGTQGASGITEKFLGSNAAAAARNLGVPVLAIPAEKPYKAIERMVVATDLKQLKRADIFSIVEDLATPHHANIRFLHVRNTVEPLEQGSSDAYKAQIGKAFNKMQPVFTFIFENDIEDGLSDALERDGADVVVVVKRERGFFQSLFHSSVSQQMVNEAALPVLVLHE